MDESRGLFLVLDGLLRDKNGGGFRLRQGLEVALKDFRSLGYRIIGIVKNDIGDLEGFDFDAVVVTTHESPSWEFPPMAWSMARRYSLNVKRSLLCSPNIAHEGWARDAGLRRFETPAILFGL